MTKVASAEREANEAQLRAIRSVPPERIGRAKAVLVETALALALAERLIPPVRATLLDRIAAVLPDLAGTVEEPIWPVVMAAQAVVEAPPGYASNSTDRMLNLCLLDYYRPRADASWARWRGQAGVPAPVDPQSQDQEQVVE